MYATSAFNLELCHNYLGDSKSQRALKLHYWFKSYGDFAECVVFAYWWSFSGGGSAITRAIPSSSFMTFIISKLIA